MFETIKYEIDNGIGRITVNRPEVLNALNIQVMQELRRAFDDVAANDDVKAVIVTGEGRSFVAGADIAQMRDMPPQTARRMIVDGHALFALMESIEKPIIAAVNGFALGGGCELAMACDFRIASTKAKFGQPEVNLGIIPGYGGTQRLPRLVGRGMAKYLVMTAEIIDAAEAYRIGLVDRLTEPEELMDKCEEIARTIMSKAPKAVGICKRLITNGADADLRTACTMEGEAFLGAFTSEDKQEGMEAFLEKRPAEFKNK